MQDCFKCGLNHWAFIGTSKVPHAVRVYKCRHCGNTTNVPYLEEEQPALQGIAVLQEIRAAIGDPEGKLTQAEVVSVVREMARHIYMTTHVSQRRQLGSYMQRVWDAGQNIHHGDDLTNNAELQEG